jgi:hypothetical protein
MKTNLFRGAGLLFRAIIPCVVAILLAGPPAARAGLTFVLDIYTENQGQGFIFYTPLVTNSILPAAPLGSYFISSPQWPTNGATRGFQLTASGLSDINIADHENGYVDMASTLQQITNGNWTILFTNATTTNFYTFKVSIPASATTSLLLPTIVTFPADGSVILTNQTTFTWQGPTNWSVSGSLQTYNINGYYQSTSLPAAQTNWVVDSSLPADTNYTFRLGYVTNYAVPVFVATTPINTNTLLPIASGWASSNILESGSSVNYAVVPAYGTPYQGHTCLAHYTFEDNNLAVHDFSGNGYDMSYAWFSVPPTIVTNDAAAGMYAGGLGGSGWFTPPASLQNLFAGSFSVSLWLQTTNVHGYNNDGLFSAAGIVSDLGSDYSESAMPMGQTGSKLAFYTGGTMQNILRSQTNINTGQYVHLVTTRDQQTGEKRIYVNGVLDSSFHAVTDRLTSSSNGNLTIGYNNGQVFAGVVDEIEFYSGVLSSNDVALLHSHPGTNVADTLELAVPVARFDFEDTNSPGTDSSGHNNSANCTSGNGNPNPNLDTYSTNAAVGTYARQFFGDTSLCFSPGSSSCLNLSNALSGDFTVTAWINTTNNVGNDTDAAYFDGPILFTYNTTNYIAPLSITGTKAAFSIADHTGTYTTLHSTTTVNDGKYHFLTVTRNRSTGLMNIYVDGQLDSSMTGPTDTVYTVSNIYLAGGYFGNYAGLLDDVRIYASELPPADVNVLYGNSPFTLGGALNAPELAWTTSGDVPWFIESTNTYDGVAAAQSGVLSDNTKYSSVQTTVTGPGVLTFWWNAVYDDNFDLEFDIDGGYGIFTDYDDFTGNEWTQDTFSIPAGVHTLSWFAYNADSTNDVGWLDQVVFTPLSGVTVLNPQNTGGNLQFQFLTQSGFTHAVQYNTSLAPDGWQTYSYIGGDGTVQNVQIPYSVFGGSKQGFVRVTTE